METITLNFTYDDAKRPPWAYEDCVIRSLAISLDVPWREVVELVDSYLDADSRFNGSYHKAGTTGIPTSVVRHVLEDLGFRRVECSSFSSITELIIECNLPNNCLALSRGHILAVLNNVVHDIFAPSQNPILEYWIN